MEFHPVANIFPLLHGSEYEALKTDIQQNGLLEPIWVHPECGRIIDGRNRWRACQDTGVTPEFEAWNGQGSLVKFVVSLNIHRRHLDSGQLAACAYDAKIELENEIKAQEALRKQMQNGTFQKIEKSETRNSTQEAAEVFFTNRQYVSDAKRLKEEAPDVFEQVKSGVVNIPNAKRLARMPLETRKLVQQKLAKGEASSVVDAARQVVKETKQSPQPLTGKHRVFYVDPPWQYGNSGLDEYGHAERHYPSMSIQELCQMGDDIKEISEDDAVMFMWVTSPFLEDCFKVINAWGFKYKSSFVWDKVKHNYGYYNSVRHEFLLICTRGSCTPDVQKLFDSVQTVERSDNHSEKPEEFRQIIDTIYPHGERLELFARRQIENWKVWGNEPTA